VALKVAETYLKVGGFVFHTYYEGTAGSWDLPTLILNLGNSWAEWICKHSGHFIPGGSAPGARWTDRMGPKTVCLLSRWDSSSVTIPNTIKGENVTVIPKNSFVTLWRIPFFLSLTEFLAPYSQTPSVYNLCRVCTVRFVEFCYICPTNAQNILTISVSW